MILVVKGREEQKGSWDRWSEGKKGAMKGKREKTREMKGGREGRRDPRSGARTLGTQAARTRHAPGTTDNT